MMLHDDINLPEQDELPDLRESLDELKRKLDKTLSAYESQCAVGQSVTVRLALTNISVQSYFICDQDEINDKTFLQFFGLLLSIQNTLSKHDKLFNDALTFILSQHVIDTQQALAAYEKLKANNVEDLKLLDKAALLTKEQKNFHHSVQDLRELLDDMRTQSVAAQSDIYKYGTNILKKVLAIKKSGNLFAKGYALFGKESFDTKFYTKVLNVTAQVLREPMNPELQAPLARICMQAPPGHSSAKRKLGGLLCMLLGALVIGFSIGICGVTLGGAVPLAIATAVLGTTLIGIGAGIFASGCQRGLAKSLVGLKSASSSEVVSAQRSSSSHIERANRP